MEGKRERERGRITHKSPDCLGGKVDGERGGGGTPEERGEAFKGRKKYKKRLQTKCCAVYQGQRWLKLVIIPSDVALLMKVAMQYTVMVKTKLIH